MLGSFLIRLNVEIAIYRRQSIVGDWPILEVVCASAITAALSYLVSFYLCLVRPRVYMLSFHPRSYSEGKVMSDTPPHVAPHLVPEFNLRNWWRTFSRNVIPLKQTIMVYASKGWSFLFICRVSPFTLVQTLPKRTSSSSS